MCAIVWENPLIHNVDVSIATRVLVEVQLRPQPPKAADVATTRSRLSPLPGT